MEDIIFRYDLHHELWDNFIPDLYTEEEAIACLQKMYSIRNLKKKVYKIEDITSAVSARCNFGCLYAMQVNVKLGLGVENYCIHCPFDTKIWSCFSNLYNDYFELSQIMQIYNLINNFDANSDKAICAIFYNIFNYEIVNTNVTVRESLMSLYDGIEKRFYKVCKDIANFPLKENIKYVDINGEIKGG